MTSVTAIFMIFFNKVYDILIKRLEMSGSVKKGNNRESKSEVYF